MKKVYYLLAALAASIAFTSCGGDNTLEPDPVGTTYPRVQLIEHFTGADCGYCPGGMDKIYEEYSKDQENIVWVSNHYGFGSDEYSIKESTTIGKKLGVQGAPSISINRYQYTNTSEGLNKAKNYHPYFTSAVMKKQETTATSCVQLERTYDAASRNLHVKATMKTADEELAGVFLTLGVTESGPVGMQHDYENSWEGWDEFIHTHVIRVYATEALGTEYVFTNRVAVAEFDIPMDAAWNADNCEIVAWITPNTNYMPVLNAAKLPVVEGTQGGENIKHGGVKMTPVPDTYPESGTPVANFVLEGFDMEMQNINGATVCNFVGYNQSLNCGQYGNYGTMFPYVDMLIVLPLGATELPVGTYNVATTQEVNTIVAGVRNDETFELDGSLLDYLFNYGGQLYIGKQWMIASGTLTVTEAGLSFSGATRNGSNFAFSYTAPAAGAPLRVAPQKRHAEYLLVNEGPAARLF